MGKRSAPLGTRLAVLIAQAPGIPPKRMAVVLKVTRSSVWRSLRQLRRMGLVDYNETEETWALIPIPGATGRFSENSRVLPNPSMPQPQHTGLKKTDTEDSCDLESRDVRRL